VQIFVSHVLRQAKQKYTAPNLPRLARRRMNVQIRSSAKRPVARNAQANNAARYLTVNYQIRNLLVIERSVLASGGKRTLINKADLYDEF